VGFEPIAVVGRGCVLPGALDPDAFWDNVAAGRCSLAPVPRERWRVPHDLVMGTVDDHLDRTWNDIGGYVTGFDEVFDAEGFFVDPERIVGLDPAFLWVLHGVRQALREAGYDEPMPRAGLVLGNLSYPTGAGSAFAAHVWLSAADQSLLQDDRRVRPDARNRFSSGLPAHFAAEALGLGAGAFALDAACASSLYAVKLACDRLHDGSADLMVAGAVNRVDNLFLHVGFCGLSAVSRTGRSRPFHRDADGLVPGEGAGFVALMRLRDAVAAGARVLGVIRGIGMSNDGRAGGLLSPAEEGQERAMRLAYAAAGLAPATVSLVECHATGTPVGDAVEARSMARVFADRADVPIGSAKSNVGHLLAPAGAGGLLKVLGAMRAGVRPPTLGADEPAAALDGTPLRLVREAEPWHGPRRAAVSAFGFGGTNAHLIVDAWDGERGGAAVRRPAPEHRPELTPVPARVPIAVVSLATRVGDGRDTDDFRRAVLGGDRRRGADTVGVALPGLCFPPVAVARTMPRQLLVLEAAREAARDVALPRETTAVVIGSGVEPEIAGAAARWRSPSWLAEAGLGTDPDLVERVRGAFSPPMVAERVVGSLPNLVANRINTQLDLAGPGFTVSAEEASGLVALELAARALRAGEADAALVGAVDLSCEPVHQAALRELGREAACGDAAVVTVLKRLDDARRDGDRVIAVLDDDASAEPDLRIGDGTAFDPGELLGRAHACHGLLCVAVAATALEHRARPRPDGPAEPDPALDSADVTVSPLGAPTVRVRLRAADPRPPAAAAAPRTAVFSGRDRRDVLAALEAGRESGDGPARLAVVGDGDPAALVPAARRWLVEGGPPPPGVLYRDRPVVGETAFVYTNGSASYPGMGGELAAAFPAHAAAVAPPSGDAPAGVLEQIWGAARLAALHTGISRNVLGLRPDAAIGYSSGESAALVALGAWPDAASLYEDTCRSGLFARELTGELRAVRRAWQRLGIPGERWASYLVALPADAIRAALAHEPAVHLMAVNAPDVCVVGGEARACAAVIDRLGEGRAVPLDYDLAAHAPELADVRDAWWTLHHRPTAAVPDVRFYSAATATWYHATAEHAADAVTAQGLGTIDFAATVDRAWRDGVRVFVEHGPRGLCTGWIKRILGDREHVAVALDTPHGSALRQLRLAAAELAVAGVPVRTSVPLGVLAAAASAPGPAIPTVDVPAHWKVTLPALDHPPVTLPRAPVLAPVTVDAAAPVTAVTTAPATHTPRADAPPAGADMRTLVARLSHQVAALHRTALAEQVAVHTAFLESRQRMTAALTRRSGPPAVLVRQQTPAAAVPTTALPSPPRELVPEQPPEPRPGPAFDRAQLEHLASGRISDLFGPAFAPQDGYAVQTRMPEPPMLLADRVTGIDAVPAALAQLGPEHATGTIRTETDVRPDSWYLDATGRIPAGLMIEAGQADLLLISWLGVDLLNRGERAYRLLGCDLTYHGERPRAGETLRYDIHIDGHARHGDVRLFFFHYDCHVDGELRLSVRNGQAGFFTREELADTDGVRWDPRTSRPAFDLPLDAPVLKPGTSRFTADQVRAFAEGRPADCFGPAWDATRAHVRSPRIDADRMLFLREIAEFDPAGGPWGRGYLCATSPVSADDWFFAGHFKNDPCMPGTLMLQGGIQAMAFYMAALGLTADKDGWRFEVVPGRTSAARCRGQATPDSRNVTYEVFVRGVSAGPYPTLYADVLGTVDGVKAFHGEDIALRLVPDWPLEHWRGLGAHREQIGGTPVPLAALGGLADHREAKPVAVSDGFAFDYASLLACAWGKPSDAFGPGLGRFDDGTQRIARLPGPPYHFMTRILATHGEQNSLREGLRVVAEYDVPDEVWFFEQNSAAVMPFAVLMEIALQPCGWLACFAGCPLTADTELLFRNLDGTGTLTGEITADTRTVRTEAELTGISRSGGMIIVTFAVRCFADDSEVFTMSTGFGYFPPSAFADQPGLRVTAAQRGGLDAPCDFAVDLTARPARYFAGPARLPDPMLLMLDRVTGYWPDAGEAGLGRLRSEKDVDPAEWFFKAHFFQDPVQPGSLGVEAMCQLLQFYVIERGLAAGVPHPRFEPLMLGRELTWKYRGQITPENRTIRVEMEIRETGSDERGPYAIGDARLWGDDTCIYEVRGIGMRVVPGTASLQASEAREVYEASDDITLDPAADTWLADHCPTYTLPALPLMSVVDLLAGGAARETGREVLAVRDVRLRRWIPTGGPVRLRLRAVPGPDGAAVTLSVWRTAAASGLSRFDDVATANVIVGERPGPRPERFAPLPDAEPQPDPYASAELFHGPAFRYLTSLRIGSAGSSAVLDAGRGTVPRGRLHQGLLDAAVQAVPHASLRRWVPEIGHDTVGYPLHLHALEHYEELPDHGPVDVEARLAAYAPDAGDGAPPLVVDVQLCVGERVLVALRFGSVLLPTGPFSRVSPTDRRDFLTRRNAVPELSLSTTAGTATHLTAADADRVDWLPGALAPVWGLPPGSRLADHLEHVAAKEHIARLTGTHPSTVTVADDLRSGLDRTGHRHHLAVSRTYDTVVVRSKDAP
jgi:acyl transferase domain-containing protein/3-hydroxymyristoyl/3-hydroxydecanoyl-(acyl carrier protein) dehydratase